MSSNVDKISRDPSLSLRMTITNKKFRLCFTSFLVLFLLAAFVLPPLPSLYQDTYFSRIVKDRNGKILHVTLSQDDKYRVQLPYKDISENIKKATILYEDRYFYYHFGVNPLSLGRAFYHIFLKHGPKLGASTITMQLARLKYQPNTRTITGKLRQIWLAIRLEIFYSKQEILEAYLNLAPYGGNIEGLGTASLFYFHKEAKELNLAEIMSLVVIPQNPSKRAPHLREENKRSLSVAREILTASWIKKYSKDRDNLAPETITNKISFFGYFPFCGPHYVRKVLKLEQTARELIGTLDLTLQQIVQKKVKSYLERKKNIGLKNAAALLVDFSTREVLAAIGSSDFFDTAIEGQVDGTLAKRSPGSTIKPFIYALAFDQGLIHPLTVLKDAPTNFDSWSPENFDQGFIGPITAKDALIRSRNVPAVELSSKLKDPNLYEFLLEAGLGPLKGEDFYGLATALGGAELTMEEIVKLYAMLANDGLFGDLKYFKYAPSGKEKRLLTREACFLVKDILKDVPQPGNEEMGEFLLAKAPVMWKTGTSYSFKDAWSIGIFGPFVLAVWVGNFDGEPNPALVGRTAAGPLFFEIIKGIHGHFGHDLPRPLVAGLPKLERIEVCSHSGKIPTKHCSHKIKTWFIPGKSPIETCDVHREIEIDRASGLRACHLPGLKNRKKEVYEFWPSDILDIFEKAGIPRKPPPPWHPLCSLRTNGEIGKKPEITSPKNGLIYNIRLSETKTNKIPLIAITDADTKKLYWFIDNFYLGAISSAKPYLWEARPGTFVVKAVDNMGRMDSRKIQVQLVK